MHEAIIIEYINFALSHIHFSHISIILCLSFLLLFIFTTAGYVRWKIRATSCWSLSRCTLIFIFIFWKQYLILKIPVLGSVWTHYIEVQSYKIITFIFLSVTSHSDKKRKLYRRMSITSILMFQLFTLLGLTILFLS